MLGIDIDGPVGEIWCAAADSVATADDGQQRTLAEWIAADPEGMLGQPLVAACGPELPIVIKLIDTREAPSVQVHPSDTYARAVEGGPGGRGKTESWLVLEAAPDAVVYHGARANPSDGLIDAFDSPAILDLLEPVPVRRGSVIDVPAGTIHTIGPGIILYEVQQRSDLTYRIYDFGRGRPIHLDRARDVSDTAAANPSWRRWLDIDSETDALVTEMPPYHCFLHHADHEETYRNVADVCQIVTRLDSGDNEPVGTTFLVPPSNRITLDAGCWAIATPRPEGCRRPANGNESKHAATNKPGASR
ncbi:MAG: hypothetical protein D6761_06160 [Candidatus Dadabacteria bacterium]|nr:MAG: hypothetical protein D6761_06160 [Candidatus Dadabacteria bacterium]